MRRLALITPQHAGQAFTICLRQGVGNIGDMSLVLRGPTVVSRDADGRTKEERDRQDKVRPDCRFWMGFHVIAFVHPARLPSIDNAQDAAAMSGRTQALRRMSA